MLRECVFEENHGRGLDVEGVGPTLDRRTFTRNITMIFGGDFTAGGYVARDDYARMANCISRPGISPSDRDPLCAPTCLDAFDADRDGDTDLADCNAFVVNFNP